MKDKIRILNEGTRVKNAVLVYDNEQQVYSLVHYDTEILRINDIRARDNEQGYLEVVKALQCSNSSTRAITQVCQFLNLDYQKYVKPVMKPYRGFSKYGMGNDITKKDIKEWHNFI